LGRALQRFFQWGQAPQRGDGFFNGALEVAHARRMKSTLAEPLTAINHEWTQMDTNIIGVY
jgi:hypothetical protein